MKQTAKAPGYFAGFRSLRSRGIVGLFVIVGIIAIASFTAMGVARASGYNVASPVRELLGLGGAAARTSAVDHVSTLIRPRISHPQPGRVVIAMEVDGDIRGDLTMILEVNQDGSVQEGIWSLVSSYVEGEHTNAPGPEPEGEGAFVSKGTLSGKTINGLVSVDANGSVSSFTLPQLTVEGGSLTFADVSQGTGSTNGLNLGDPASAGGNLVLTF